MAGSAALTPDSETVNVILIHRPGHAQFYTHDLESVTAEAEAMLDAMDEDDELILRVRRMERAEYDALPEFTGW